MRKEKRYEVSIKNENRNTAIEIKVGTDKKVDIIKVRNLNSGGNTEIEHKTMSYADRDSTLLDDVCNVLEYVGDIVQYCTQIEDGIRVDIVMNGVVEDEKLVEVWSLVNSVYKLLCADFEIQVNSDVLSKMYDDIEYVFETYKNKK